MSGWKGSAQLDEFEEQRERLFGIAYRMLGSATDAEDVLQDAWLRWQAVDRPRVAQPAAFLARTVTNLCLTALGPPPARAARCTSGRGCPSRCSPGARTATSGPRTTPCSGRASRSPC